jgi:hypothetical protein
METQALRIETAQSPHVMQTTARLGAGFNTTDNTRRLLPDISDTSGCRPNLLPSRTASGT